MSTTLTGVVERISESENRDDSSVTVRHGPKPKKSKDGMHIGRFPPTTSLDLPRKDVRQFKIGDKVEIEVRKASKNSTLQNLRNRRNT